MIRPGSNVWVTPALHGSVVCVAFRSSVLRKLRVLDPFNTTSQHPRALLSQNAVSMASPTHSNTKLRVQDEFANSV